MEKNITSIDPNGLKILCWEGYEHASITDPFTNSSGIPITGETLLSDQVAAMRLLDSALEKPIQRSNERKEQGKKQWDLLNINNAYIKDCLFTEGLIKVLDEESFQRYKQDIHPIYDALLHWSYADNGDLIGIGQRYGPFNLVINNQMIDEASARDQGFNLANDAMYSQRFGILDYPDFNVFHFCIGAGLNPFVQLDQSALDKFRTLTRNWISRAALISDDHHKLNKALVDNEIDFYISGGVYTASPARLNGYSQVLAVTPDSGPIEGRGGIVFSEITSILSASPKPVEARKFLQYMLEPETAIRIAFMNGTCNPVAQMGNPDVMKGFSIDQLKAIQWETLGEDVSRCAQYQIPPNNRELLDILAQEKLTSQVTL